MKYVETSDVRDPLEQIEADIVAMEEGRVGPRWNLYVKIADLRTWLQELHAGDLAGLNLRRNKELSERIDRFETTITPRTAKGNRV